MFFNNLRITGYPNKITICIKKKAAIEETHKYSILINDYLRILNKCEWCETNIIQFPMSSEQFQANVAAAMQKKKILGVTSRYVIVAKKQAIEY